MLEQKAKVITLKSDKVPVLLLPGEPQNVLVSGGVKARLPLCAVHPDHSDPLSFIPQFSGHFLRPSTPLYCTPHCGHDITVLLPPPSAR